MVKATKTINPLHFEDLEPHRFEDLVRQLIYDLRDWQNIEATGRSGSDDGFDIRAWEKLRETIGEDEEGDGEGEHAIEGHPWMIQCKRKRDLGPSEVKKIINSDIKKGHSLYGYILVAPSNFSKKSYDIFREELRNKGVSEFYMWGRAELEDMLMMPKNDHILFTFFGLSLVSRRRSRASEIRFLVNNKNKLMRILGDISDAHKSILARDANDTHYPYEEKYKDFNKNKRWQEHVIHSFHPLGLDLKVSRYFGYIDYKNKKYDFIPKIDLLYREGDVRKTRDEDKYKEREKIMDFWKHLPRIHQADFLTYGIIKFEDMLLIDDRGDVLYNFPHIFVDFKSHGHPFAGFYNMLERRGNKTYLGDGWKRIKIFPKIFPDGKIGKIYEEKQVIWDSETIRLFRETDRITNLYDVDGKYSFLKPRDWILVSGASFEGISKNQDKIYIEITHKYNRRAKDYLSENLSFSVKEDIERQIGKTIQNTDKLTIFEFEKKYEFSLPKNK